MSKYLPIKNMEIQTPNKEDFKKVMNLINQIIKESEKYKNDKLNNEAINWRDLKCYAIQFCIDEDYNYSWLATVDEAAPDCWKFCNHIHDEMKKLGYNVYVETEW